MTGWRIELLEKHDRTSFISGSDALDRYFKEQVTQDVRRKLCFCFVLVSEAGEIGGYYTLSAVSVAFDKLPPERTKKLPRYPIVPAALLGRLAIAQAHRGKRLGGALMADAMMRASRSEVRCHLMLVDAKDDTAAAFYEHLGFSRLLGEPLKLIRPL